MKATLIKYIMSSLFAMALSVGAFAQSTTNDSEMGNAHDLDQIVDEWNEWHTNPTPQNAFVEEFLNDYNVPKSGQHGLNRKETWFWWASHHPVEVQEYIDRKNNQ